MQRYRIYYYEAGEKKTAATTSSHSEAENEIEALLRLEDTSVRFYIEQYEEQDFHPAVRWLLDGAPDEDDILTEEDLAPVIIRDLRLSGE